MKESRIPFWELHGEVCELKSAQREAGQRKRRKNTKKIFAKWKCFILASKSVQNSQQTPNVEKDVKKWDLNKIRWDRRGIILGSAAQNTSTSQHRHRGVSGSFETFEQFKIVPLHFGTLIPVFRHLQLMINIECFFCGIMWFFPGRVAPCAACSAYSSSATAQSSAAVSSNQGKLDGSKQIVAERWLRNERRSSN